MIDDEYHNCIASNLHLRVQIKNELYEISVRLMMKGIKYSPRSLWLRSLLPILSKGERKKTQNQLADSWTSPMQESGITKYQIQEEETNENLPICDTRRKEHHYLSLIHI